MNAVKFWKANTDIIICTSIVDNKFVKFCKAVPISTSMGYFAIFFCCEKYLLCIITRYIIPQQTSAVSILLSECLPDGTMPARMDVGGPSLLPNRTPHGGILSKCGCNIYFEGL